MIKKYLSKTIFSGIFLLFLFFFLTLGVAHALTVTMISRLDFVPSMLEMLKINLEHSLKSKISLNFQPVLCKRPVELRKLPDLLIVENGFPKNLLPRNFRLMPDAEISLVWVLGLNSKAKKLLGNKPLSTLKDFGKLLVSLKKQNTSTFPWFESLFSKNTLFNMSLVLGERKNKQLRLLSEKDFWLYGDFIRILYEAMGENLLNPLSLESDELLAFNVFASGDCAATTLWVPSEFLIDTGIASKYLGNTLLLPFPTISGKAIVPKVSFKIYKNNKSKFIGSIASICLENKESYLFIDCKFQKALDLINNKYAECYDQLLVGDF